MLSWLLKEEISTTWHLLCKHRGCSEGQRQPAQACKRCTPGPSLPAASLASREQLHTSVGLEGLPPFAPKEGPLAWQVCALLQGYLHPSGTAKQLSSALTDGIMEMEQLMVPNGGK